MKEINLRNEKRMIEIDETTNILEYLKDNMDETTNFLEYLDEMFNQQVKIITYYLDDSTNDWVEMPIFSIVSWGDSYEVTNHYLGIEVYDDIYNILVKRNLIERV